jgi:hypothetical protein
MNPATEKQLVDDVRDIKLAVIGDEKIGQDGLVKQVRSIQAWRKKLDLRIAAMTGGALTLFYLGKFLLELTFSRK